MKLNYQEQANKPGVYKIVNTASGRLYIGQASRLKRLWRGHATSLRTNKHQCKFLQSDFNDKKKKLGNDDFLEFHVLRVMEGSTKKEREIAEEEFIKFFMDSGDDLYNTIKTPSKVQYTSEAKETMSEAKKLFYKTSKGKKLIKSLGLQKKGKTYEELYGLEQAKAIRERISSTKLIQMNEPARKERLRELLTGVSFKERFGEVRALEIKQKMQEQRKGKYVGVNSSRFMILDNIKLISPLGEVFTRIDGITEFAKAHGLSCNHLSELLSGKRKSHSGWRIASFICT